MMPSLVPSEWAELVSRFQTDDGLFQKYYRLVHAYYFTLGVMEA